MFKKFYQLTMLTCLLGTIGLFTTSCSSLEPMKLANSNDTEPEWVNSNQVTFQKDNKLFAIGQAEAQPHARPSALYRVSDANAKSLIFQKIKSENEYNLSGNESGVESTGSYDFNFNEKSKLSLSNIEINERYWKVVKITDEDGEEKLRKIAYSLVSLDLKTIKSKTKELANAQ